MKPADCLINHPALVEKNEIAAETGGEKTKTSDLLAAVVGLHEGKYSAPGSYSRLSFLSFEAFNCRCF